MRDIQAALAAQGYTPGPIDGIWGRQTAAAVRRFQADHSLAIDSIPGPLTLSKLLGSQEKLRMAIDDPTLLWLNEARRLMGTREKPGAGSNPMILDWASDMNVMYKSDDIPWCGLFAGHCVTATLPDEPVPTGLLRARAWERFGIPTAPTLGAVMVFWRRSPTSGLGHVGFYAGEDDDAFRIIGGNQSDSVSIAWIGKSRLVAARWPASVPARLPLTVTARRNERLSWSEA